MVMDKARFELGVFDALDPKHPPQPSLILDTGNRARAPAMAAAHMLAATVWLSMPRGATWSVNIDEAVMVDGKMHPNKRRVWLQLAPGDSQQQAIDVLRTVARREGV